MIYSCPMARRQLMAVAALTSLGAFSLRAIAQAADAYPKKPIRFVIGTPPGSGTDNNARFLSTRLAPVLGQSIIVDNKPGAHSQIAVGHVKNAERDGYTLLFAAGGTMAINPALYGNKLPYNTLKDFDPIVGLEQAPIYLAVNKDLPVNNLNEMIAYVKARPNAVNYGTGGGGTTSHIAMEMLKKSAGIQMTHVPYRGSAMVLQDLIGGQIQFAFDAASVMLPASSRGHVRLIAMASPRRSKATPDIPTVAEQGFPGFEATTWSGLYAPKGTPAAIIALLNEAVNRELRSVAFAAKQTEIGSVALGGSSEEFRSFIERELAHWDRVVKETGVKPE